MKIEELKPKQGNIDITVECVEKGDVREFTKFGKTGRVCNITVKDESGEMRMTLWNDDVDKVNVGDTVKLDNGYVNEYKGEMQLTAGRAGKIDVLKSSPKDSSKEQPDVQEEELDVEEEVI